MTKLIEIEIKLSPFFKNYTPEMREPLFKLIFENSVMPADIIKELGIANGVQKLILVNGTPVQDNYRLRDGDSVAIFPAITGG